MPDEKTESTEIKPFDPQEAMNNIKLRIKSTFVEMIPDEQWNAMVKKEVDDFFREKDRGYSNKREYFSDFQLLTKQALEEEGKARLKAFLTSPEFQVIWDNNGHLICSKAVEEMIVNNSGAIMINMFGGMFTQMIHQFSQNIPRQF